MVERDKPVSCLTWGNLFIDCVGVDSDNMMKAFKVALRCHCTKKARDNEADYKNACCFMCCFGRSS